MTTQPDECESCSWPTEKLNEAHGGLDRSDKVWMCDVCYSTLVGNAYLYPNQYRDSAVILRTIAVCTNMVLAKLEDRG